LNRLQKKCFIVSASLHLLLLLILVVGPAFLVSKNKSDDVEVIEFVPAILIDQNVIGGGNRNAKAPAAQASVAPPPQPAPQPPPPKPREPEPEKIVPKELKDPDIAENRKPSKPRTPDISTKVVTRNPEKRIAAKPDPSIAEAQAHERQLADRRRRLANQITSAARNIREGMSSATEIEPVGPGGGGPAYASYAALVRTIYENAWEAPQETATDDAITKVSVTIGSDGTVLSSRITRASGDSPVDRSVQRTLDRVGFIAPFPEGSKDKQRTYIINFNLKAKRGLA